MVAATDPFTNYILLLPPGGLPIGFYTHNFDNLKIDSAFCFENRLFIKLFDGDLAVYAEILKK